MQIRLTVAVAPRGVRGTGDTGGAGAARTPQAQPSGSANVLVTAPTGTVLAAVTSALATSAAAALSASSAASSASHAPGSGPGSRPGPEVSPAAQGAEEKSQEPVVVYAGTRRLDPHRQIIGEPPLLDGAMISLHAPVTPAALPAHGAAVTAYGSAKARLHVVAGPDAGGIHLLQGGKVHLGRSAEADVPLDDPDVSRLHCAVTVTDGGAVTVTDVGSTNGTSIDGAPVGGRPVLFRPGSTLRIGETAIRLEAAGAPGHETAVSTSALPPLALPTAPDSEGRLRVVRESIEQEADQGGTESPGAPGAGSGAGPAPSPHAEPPPPGAAAGPGTRDRGRGGPGGHAYAPGGPFPNAEGTHGAGFPPPSAAGREGGYPPAGQSSEGDRRRARGLGAWARRFAGGRGEAAGPGAGPEGPASAGRPYDPAAPAAPYDPDSPYDPAAAHGPNFRYAPDASHPPHPAHSRGGEGGVAHPAPEGPEGFAARRAPGGALETWAGAGHGARLAPHEWDARWPDPAAVLLSALGPGPRLWERTAAHPDALTVRLGVAHRSDGHGEPVTVDLRQAGSLGLAGPRARLAGLTRAVLAQLTALHGPSALEVVLLSADRARSAAARAEEWSWLGWLPHLRPSHGQDCALLTAYDREQAAARTAELTRRLEAHASAPGGGPPSSAVLVVVDGDPGSATLRESMTRLAREGAGAGIHLLCLAETPAASPASPVAATVEAASAACPAFSECGTLALLSGDVATAVRVLHRAPRPPHGYGGGDGDGDGHGPRETASGPAGPHGSYDAYGTHRSYGTHSSTDPDEPHGSEAAAFTAPAGPVATVDAVSGAWAERFARALAPLREPEGSGAPVGSARPAVTLPSSCRLLDELGLARATPAALLARWSEAAPGGGTSGRAPLVFGAGPHGPLEADLADLSPLAAPAVRTPASGEGQRLGAGLPGHALISGGPGTGKTELLRSLSASLAAGERPDRLALVLVDGAGAGAGDGLRACAELPHVTGHLAAGDPVRMREFAQALSAELKRRAELIGDQRGYEEYVRLAARPGGRVVAQRQSSERAPAHAQVAGGPGVADTPAADTYGAGTSPAEGEPPQERAELASGQPARQGGVRTEERPVAEGPGALDTLPPQTASRAAESGPAPAQPQERRRHTQGPAPAEGPRSGSGSGAGSGAGGAGAGAGDGTGGEQAPEPDVTRRTMRLRTRDGERAGAGPGAAAAGRAADLPAAFAVRGGPEGVLPRLAVLVDDFDTLVDPALGNPGRPAAGSVVRALEAVARLGGRLGVHLIAATGRPERTAATAVAQGAALQVELAGAEGGTDSAPRGRGILTFTQRRAPVPAQPQGPEHGNTANTANTTNTANTAASGASGEGPGIAAPPIAFQAGRVTGRIPRTATLRPTVVPLDWARTGDPPARRPVRELGNGPTDLALLASAMERAAQQASQPS
ncbi:FHA domain-containing protein [Streptomyces sp. NBC_01187]|uniref:FHA domain-containing protein n=1 Tax=Streptomyces sp. NBC_01187 TaxID=2903766 RepID=UPI003869B41B|nr:FtsK/SpoIIIE domain-containing protein [Streptomyces sp. NBC_01187]